MSTLKKSSLGGIAFLLFRLYQASIRSFKDTVQKFKFAFKSKEHHTYTYRLSNQNRYYLILLVSKITGKDFATIKSYFEEVENDLALHQHIINTIKNSFYRNKKDLRSDLGSRIAFYAIIRANKPKVVVEMGIDIGYCAVVLCSALLRNKEEGSTGTYYGLDCDPNAGMFVWEEPYAKVTKILIGDGIESIGRIEGPIDFYYSDNGQPYDYEQVEFAALAPRIADQGVVVSNKAAYSTALAELALSKGRKFAYFKESPLDHWFQGTGLGFLY
jgi:predicted O-methyltransferase YrrM